MHVKRYVSSSSPFDIDDIPVKNAPCYPVQCALKVVQRFCIMFGFLFPLDIFNDDKTHLPQHTNKIP